MKLEIELVPKTSWYNNLRKILSKSEWDQIRKQCYEQANYKCEICGDTGKNQGYSHDVECHEIWEYDDENYLQKLKGFIALCPMCHKAKHIGLAFVKNEGEKVKEHFKEVNDLEDNEARRKINEAFETFKIRSQYNWETDISLKEKYLRKND